MKPLRKDPVLSKLMEQHPEVSLEPADEPFERTVVSIINQQLSTDSARAIRDRVFDQFEVTPESMLAAEEEVLREAGLSGQKVEYIRHIAEAHRDGRMSRGRFDGMPDEQVISELTEIRGIGVWTAKMYLLFCLAREDVFPVEDLGIRRAMTELYELEGKENMKQKAAEWRPYRSYSSLYLWRAMD